MADVATPAVSAANATTRPSVLSLSIKDKSALYAAYMPFLKNGGIFVPTNKPYELGEEVYLLLSLMDDTVKYPIAGKVVWLTPSAAHNNRSQGIGVHFSDDEGSVSARARIEALLSTAIASARNTHTL